MYRRTTISLWMSLLLIITIAISVLFHLFYLDVKATSEPTIQFYDQIENGEIEPIEAVIEKKIVNGSVAEFQVTFTDQNGNEHTKINVVVTDNDFNNHLEGDTVEIYYREEGDQTEISLSTDPYYNLENLINLLGIMQIIFLILVPLIIFLWITLMRSNKKPTQ